MNTTHKRTILLVVAVAGLAFLAGCNETEPTGEQLGEASGVNVSNSNLGESWMFETKLTERNQYGLVKAQPPFIMDESLERQNLIRRYQYLNNQNNIHHVYMMSNDGKVIAYRVAQGKVSSVNSKLTNDKQIVARNECLKNTHDGGEGACYETVESPQMDGSYGSNGAAIFFFTTDGSYVEYNGIYVVSEDPMNIQTQVSLVEMDNGSDTNSNASNIGQTNATAPMLAGGAA